MARLKRPLVAVTGSDEGSYFAWLFIRANVFLAGGRCRRFTPSRFEAARSEEALEEIRALVISGGADVDPTLYGETLATNLKQERATLKRHPLRAAGAFLLYEARRRLSRGRRQGLDKARDLMEIRCLEHAIGRGLPVLGICRGAQLMNVFFGGSLYQSILDFYVEAPAIRSFLPKKKVEVPAGSRLSRMLNCASCWVNSLHKQSVKAVGKGLRVVARETNGVVQAIEHESLTFVLGVQWHPEYLIQRREQRAIFRRLVEAASCVVSADAALPPARPVRDRYSS